MLDNMRDSSVSQSEEDNAVLEQPSDPVATTDEEMLPIQQTNSAGPPYSIHSKTVKRLIVLAVSVISLFSPLSAQIYLPALIPISKSLHVSSAMLNLTITTYMVFQGLTPMFVGSFADTSGRRPAYIGCFVVYLAANIGLARASSFGAVLALRCLQSAGSSSTIALCTATVADMITSAERGQYVGFTIIPVVLAPSVGPVLGGVLSQHLGWRSIFWFLVISAAVTLIFIVLLLPETCRVIVGDGSIRPPPLYRSLLQAFWQRREVEKTAADARPNDNDFNAASPSPPREKSSGFKFKPPNVLAAMLMLVRRSAAILLWSSSMAFAGFYCLTVAMPVLLHQSYRLNETQVGLMYLPIAVGSIIAGIFAGPVMTLNYKRHCVRQGVAFDRRRQLDMAGFPIERARLEIGIPLLALTGTVVVAWGWAMQAHAHLAVLCVINALLGVGLIGINNSINILLVDLHPGKAGTATAANNFTRCLVGAGTTAAIIPLEEAVGVGVAFTIVGCLVLVCIVPLTALAMEWRRQMQRKESEEKLQQNST